MLPNLDFDLTGRWLLAGWIAAVAIFVGVPSVDLWISGLFWHPGVGFPLGNRPSWDWLRRMIWNAEIGFFFIALFAWLRALIRHRRVLGLTARAWAYGWTLFLIAPMVLVHEVIKVQWARARPVTIQEFGGHKIFSRAGEITDQCTRNCSFVSGEVSSAVALAVCLWLMSSMWRGLETWQRWYIRAAAIAIPVFITIQRVSAGRHFASDAVFGALVTLTIAWALYAVFSGVVRLGLRGGAGAGRS
ncbi:MAG TPA: phosphatase PAP2 family protein [Paenirhodobacter sp.]